MDDPVAEHVMDSTTKLIRIEEALHRLRENEGLEGRFEKLLVCVQELTEVVRETTMRVE